LLLDPSMYSEKNKLCCARADPALTSITSIANNPCLNMLFVALFIVIRVIL
jgi:hypothetical protein